MDKFLIKCKLCDKEFDKYDSLKRHMCRIHKTNSVNFYVEFYLGGIWPVCECGCGGKVKWSYQLKGFTKFCQGHQSRVHNNWGHNKKAIANSTETRKKQFNLGERKVWNDGLTVKDERVRNNIKSAIISINSNPKELKRRSELMKLQRKNGTIPTLYGPESSQWKGGISEINNIARNDKRLYDEWKYPILIRDGFKCIKCKNTDNLHIHHDKETMSEIVKKHIVDEEPKDFELKKLIADKVVDYHINNKVSGITLCGECHGKIHPSLNFD